MTEKLTSIPPKDPREATEEETQAERAQRQKKQKHQKLRRTLIIVLAALLLAASLVVLGPVVYQLAFPAGAGQADPQPAQTSSAAQTPAQTQTQAQSAPSDTSSEQTPPAAPSAASSSASSAQTSAQTQPEVPAEPEQTVPAATEPETSEPEQTNPAAAYASETEKTQTLDLQMYSKNAILIDLSDNTVIAEKNPDDKIYPASMTKLLTALVASEHITNWDDTFTMTQAIIDPLYKAGASLAGFEANETVTLRELLYGALLPSGAEATEALAIYVAGSENDFVALMNEKAQALGLTTAHFMNASGLHDKDHYCTVRDMAVILQAVLANPECRAALTSTTHTTPATEQHPDGLAMTDKFLYRVASQDLKGCKILGAKTGYTAEAGNCCASYGVSPDGRECICVTAQAWTSWYAIYDHIAMYATYADK